MGLIYTGADTLAVICYLLVTSAKRAVPNFLFRKNRIKTLILERIGSLDLDFGWIFHLYELEGGSSYKKGFLAGGPLLTRGTL